MTYHPKVIEFFKRHNLYDEKMFEYLQKRTIMVDYRDPDQRMFIGFSTFIKKNILKNFTICIPYMENEITMLNNIHEITHGICAYKKLNKKYSILGCEAIPMLMEKIYVLETGLEKLDNHSEYLDSLIDEDSEDKYKFALKNRDLLLSEFDDDFDSISRLNDRLIKKEELRLKLSKYFKS